MAYQITATKLQTYQRCPQLYYFRYERKVGNPASFKSPQLGLALHQALARFYQDWHYLDPKPKLAWLQECWQQPALSLSEPQKQEGWDILLQYFDKFVESESTFRRPLAIEGRIQGELQQDSLAFKLTGRYDRLDWLDDGLELIDYKTSKAKVVPEPLELNIQLGLYYLALSQHYPAALKRISLIYLRTTEKLSYQVTADHYQQVESLITELAQKLRNDENWDPSPAEDCQKCTYAQYCPSQQTQPDPLPASARSSRSGLQLILELNSSTTRNSSPII